MRPGCCPALCVHLSCPQHLPRPHRMPDQCPGVHRRVCGESLAASCFNHRRPHCQAALTETWQANTCLLVPWTKALLAKAHAVRIQWHSCTASILTTPVSPEAPGVRDGHKSCLDPVGPLMLSPLCVPCRPSATLTPVCSSPMNGGYQLCVWPWWGLPGPALGMCIFWGMRSYQRAGGHSTLRRLRCGWRHSSET